MLSQKWNDKEKSEGDQVTAILQESLFIWKIPPMQNLGLSWRCFIGLHLLQPGP